MIKARVEACARAFDSDGNGAISAEEFVPLFCALIGLPLDTPVQQLPEDAQDELKKLSGISVDRLISTLMDVAESPCAGPHDEPQWVKEYKAAHGGQTPRKIDSFELAARQIQRGPASKALLSASDQKSWGSTVAFHVRGQDGVMPAVGLGTATLFGEACIAAVRAGIRAGFRHIDTALLYDNQEAVGEAIKQAIAAGEVTREELFVTTKVAFYPAAADGTNTTVHLRYEPCNKKGLEETRAAVDVCLQRLQLSFVDLLLIHNPCTNLEEYQASSAPHCFELSGSVQNHLSLEERALLLQHRLSRAQAVYDEAVGEAARASSWRALEEARAANKCRFIGVSNYPARLIQAMEHYATVQPAVNQLELHPFYSSPTLRALAQQMGMVLTAYGSGNFARIAAHSHKQANSVLATIAARHNISTTAVVLKWTLQREVSVIVRTTSHFQANLAAASPPALSAQDMQALDQLDQAHPFYWWPIPLLPAGATN